MSEFSKKSTRASDRDRLEIHGGKRYQFFVRMAARRALRHSRRCGERVRDRAPGRGRTCGRALELETALSSFKTARMASGRVGLCQSLPMAAQNMGARWPRTIWREARFEGGAIGRWRAAERWPQLAQSRAAL